MLKVYFPSMSIKKRIYLLLTNVSKCKLDEQPKHVKPATDHI